MPRQLAYSFVHVKNLSACLALAFPTQEMLHQKHTCGGDLLEWLS